MTFVNLQWKEFPISLPHLFKYLKESYSDFDGLICDEDSLRISFFEQLDQGTIDDVIDYYDGLTEESETQKIHIDSFDFEGKITAIKQNMLDKAWKDMSSLERKIIINILDDGDKEAIMNYVLA